MANAQKVDYGSKSGEIGHDKELSDKPLEMIKAGAESKSSDATGSSRSYPKNGKVSLVPDFTPIKKTKRSGSDWAVGGV